MPVSSAYGFSVDIKPSPFVFMAEQTALAVDIRSFREPLKRAIQGVIAPSIQHNFDVGGRPEWEPLAEATIANKVLKGSRNPEQILVDTGKLQRVAGQLNIWKIDGIKGEAFVQQLPGAEYGGYHQSGTKNMPAREFLTIQDEDMDEVELVFDIWLRERFRAKGWSVA